MLHTKCYRKIFQTTLRHLNVHLSANVSVNYCSYTKSKFLRTLLPNVVQYRHASYDRESDIVLPPLFEEPKKLVYPNFFKAFKNLITINFLLPRLDKDFNMSEFLKGAKKAWIIVSKAMSEENYESISGLVTEDTILACRNKIIMLSPEQKKLIAVNDDDLIIIFPYEVGIMFGDNAENERYAEITVVYHSYRNYDKIADELQDRPWKITFTASPELRKNVYISNVRFICDFSKGVEPSWTINMINHFMILSC